MTNPTYQGGPSHTDKSSQEITRREKPETMMIITEEVDDDLNSSITYKENKLYCDKVYGIHKWGPNIFGEFCD